MRRPIVAGNWKMHGTFTGAARLAEEVRQRVEGVPDVEVVICPPFTALAAAGPACSTGSVKLGAQDVHWEEAGAFTGAISPAMLRDLSCAYVIVGHSERRTLFGETDENVRRKLEATLAEGPTPILCVGETLTERERDATERVLRRQVDAALDGIGEETDRVVVAYEPVWAIGTGRTASPDQAQSAHAFIRGIVADLAGPEIAARVRILYGGSAKPDNAAELFAGADVDGGLIGGASLDAGSFEAIVRAAAAGLTAERGD